MKQVYRLFSSKTLALYLFGALIVLLIPRSLFSDKLPALDTAIDIFLGLICLNLIVCTIRRFKSLSRPVLFTQILSE